MELAGGFGSSEQLVDVGYGWYRSLRQGTCICRVTSAIECKVDECGSVLLDAKDGRESTAIILVARIRNTRFRSNKTPTNVLKRHQQRLL